ncbi:hypothetical protein ACWIG3_26230 [Streptomyces celluloflavus]|uniref:Uncharacterized protein n=2 Tax=Streptomyces TaxID=1883 RepID=A0A4Q9HNY0_STRKA|nr:MULTISPECIES: hypothetical protein [Streptomyces]MYU50498.1 hypothetical protein [Streptomyces sp. SID7805]TBO56574.1 hypothetical protein EYS09_27220 [Streptomyces kasugaensis]WSK17050.1 hypothetical protein OG717_38115 [Streptomyces celluloflavus]
MVNNGAPRWETAILDGGPADGMRVRVADRPSVLQVNRPCAIEDPQDGVRDPQEVVHVAALHIYRRDLKVKSEPLRYGFDGVSP